MRTGHRGPDKIRYDLDGLEIRTSEKMSQLVSRLPLASCDKTLELGCMDGMVARALAQAGKKAMALDLSRDAFEAMAQQSGVQFVQGDACQMPLPDACVDLVYSFAAFEHFDRPEACVSECRRVLKKGGYLYLSFGPVYTSPFGLHAYREVPIPYCQYLFKNEDLIEYAKQNGLRYQWPFVNGFTVTQYQRIWDRFRPDFEALYYKEHPTGAVGAELIRRFPQCFKGRVEDTDDFFVSAIELCWRKI